LGAGASDGGPGSLCILGLADVAFVLYSRALALALWRARPSQFCLSNDLSVSNKPIVCAISHCNCYVNSYCMTIVL